MQKYSPSHISTGEVQAHRGSAGAAYSGIGNEQRPSSCHDRWRVCGGVDSRACFPVFCTPTPACRSLDILSACKPGTEKADSPLRLQVTQSKGTSRRGAAQGQAILPGLWARCHLVGTSPHAPSWAFQTLRNQAEFRLKLSWQR